MKRSKWNKRAKEESKSKPTLKGKKGRQLQWLWPATKLQQLQPPCFPWPATILFSRSNWKEITKNPLPWPITPSFSLAPSILTSSILHPRQSCCWKDQFAVHSNVRYDCYENDKSSYTREVSRFCQTDNHELTRLWESLDTIRQMSHCANLIYSSRRFLLVDSADSIVQTAENPSCGRN